MREENSYLISYADSDVSCGNKSPGCVWGHIVVSIDWTAIDDPADLSRRIGSGSSAEHSHVVPGSSLFRSFDRNFRRSDCGNRMASQTSE
jgi:hypothetical protein